LIYASTALVFTTLTSRRDMQSLPSLYYRSPVITRAVPQVWNDHNTSAVQETYEHVARNWHVNRR